MYHEVSHYISSFFNFIFNVICVLVNPLQQLFFCLSYILLFTFTTENQINAVRHLGRHILLGGVNLFVSLILNPSFVFKCLCAFPLDLGGVDLILLQTNVSNKLVFLLYAAMGLCFVMYVWVP